MCGIFSYLNNNGGLTNEFPSTPHYEHSEFGNISENLLSQIQNPDSQVGGEITFGNPTTTNYSLGTGIYSGLETYDSDNINTKKITSGNHYECITR